MSDTQSQESVINSTSTSDPKSASPGELLSRQREQLGIPLADAARALNLRPAVVGGLEQDNYQEIPVAAYRRGYLRSYAKYLGMDDRLVLEAYQAHNKETDVDRKVTPVSFNKPPSRLGAWLFKLVTLLVIAGLIAVTVMWWQSRGGNTPPGFSSSSTPEAPTQEESVSARDESNGADAVEAQSPSAGSSFTSGDDSATLQSDATNVTPSPSALQDQAASNEDNADPIAAFDPPTPTETDDQPQAPTDAAESDDQSSPEPEPATNANTLELTFNEQSWTEIFDATNQRVFVGLQTPGTTATVEGEPPFRLTVGNATGVELRYQGEEVDLPAQAGANNVARFTLGE
ncbi:RodZ family helix-turn-helix domain-containing protein [Halovibrio sp. HP20-50]|uniref:RodZ family helix-turn-helix domain-containing protein n=1 Tax=Halovibrio sp. HP20-59 TaxID=3080275 RepID=UPI00294A9D15|nr:RodZ family helix-turn-helix domain-containing protein [Halovibrio sp. HP20-59]MEA2120342.1 RodZ family helix-turn-helix domain-containing protein [Halovibrio sp. HP20-59]